MEKKRAIAELKATIKQRDNDNGALDKDLMELNVAVNERRHIDNVNGRSFIHCHTIGTVHQSCGTHSMVRGIFAGRCGCTPHASLFPSF